MPIDVPRGRRAYGHRVPVEKDEFTSGDALIGSRIRAARDSERLSQEELGRRIGLTQNSVSDYECGKTPFTVEMLKRFAAALEHDWQYLAEGPRGPTVPNTAKRAVEQFLYGLSKSGWRKMAALSREEHAELARQVEALLTAKSKPPKGRRGRPPK